MASNQEVISVTGLNKYFGTNHAVNNVDLKVKRGEIFGFLGPNGSGKTTTIRMLCGLLTPDSGSGHCLGYDILTESRIIKQHVGYMTQRFSFYEDLTLYENLDFIARIYKLKNRKQRIEEIIEQFDFTGRRDQLTGELSGGWKQRVALAAALLHKPDLLLLDEPTAGVDPSARREFWDNIHHLSEQGITTLVSTHYMDEAERCTRLGYIAFGELLVEGTIEDVIAKSQLISWSIKGENLVKIAEKLKAVDAVEQVVMFGQTLHVSGHDEQGLAQAIKPYQEDYQCQKIRVSLEDIFINLVEHSVQKREA